MGRSRQEEPEQLERLQPDHLRPRPQHLEDGPHAALGVKGRHQGGGVVAHQAHDHVEDVVEVLVLVDGGEEVEHGLQLVLLDAVADHDELLHEEEHVAADRQDVRFGGTGAVWKTN